MGAADRRIETYRARLERLIAAGRPGAAATLFDAALGGAPPPERCGSCGSLETYRRHVEVAGYRVFRLRCRTCDRRHHRDAAARRTYGLRL